MQDNKFGKHLRKLRKRKSLKLSFASYDGDGINPSTISRIENGQVDPKLSTLIKLADALGMKLKDLVDF